MFLFFFHRSGFNTLNLDLANLRIHTTVDNRFPFSCEVAEEIQDWVPTQV